MAAASSHPTRSRYTTGYKGSGTLPEVEVQPLDIWFRCKRCNHVDHYNVYAGVPRCSFCTGAPQLEAVGLVNRPDPLNEYMKDVDRWKDEVKRQQDTGSSEPSVPPSPQSNEESP